MDKTRQTVREMIDPKPVTEQEDSEKVFNLEIDMIGGAFQDEYNRDGHELARILRDIADQMENYGTVPTIQRTVRDVNGNTVGEFTVQPKTGKTPRPSPALPQRD